uniref:Uncharacterized protein n=1 Tax=Arsenophonus endosymbiont of Trialeurodes vaporariorum TaxID=235567 RepID=A0A3B0MIR8_9GAMM
MEELTYGEKAVDLQATKGNELDIYVMKRRIADVINQLHAERSQSDNPEIKRMLSIVITDLQTAAMRATQALTWKY